MPKMLPNEEILTDLVTRFILNVPYSEWEYVVESGRLCILEQKRLHVRDINLSQYRTFERLMFLVEQAHWHYEDCVVEANPKLKSLSMKEFTTLLFDKVPGLEGFKSSASDILRDWQQYKSIVPVNGAIMLDPTLEKCLLVRGYKSNAGWGFPRGKVAKDEDDVSCAIREVKEETGFDIAPYIQANEFVEVMMGGQRSKLFIIPGIPETTVFCPQVRKEIGAFAWHSIAELPSDREEGSQVYITDSGERHRFFMVWPYVKPLRRWIKNYKRGGKVAVVPVQVPAGNAGGGKQRRGPPPAVKLQRVDNAWLTPAAGTSTATGAKASGSAATGAKASAGKSAAGARTAASGGSAVAGGVVEMPAAWKQWKLDTDSVIMAMGRANTVAEIFLR